MAQKMFYLIKVFQKLYGICMLAFVFWRIYTCQPGQHLFNVNRMSTCSMDFRQRSINMANLQLGFFFVTFQFYQGFALCILKLYGDYYVFSSIYCFSSGYIQEAGQVV